MNQLSKSKAILYHLYPGACITLGFIIFAPLAIRHGFPPQFAMLVAIVLVAVPLLLWHLRSAEQSEQKNAIKDLNGFREKLPAGKLIAYAVGLVIFAFLMYGATLPLNKIIADKFLTWLPSWYSVQDFAGYDRDKLKIMLILNLLLNGFLAPYIEELYFRGYLLARMEAFGGSAFAVNAILFSLYHFWQPDIYLTLILALMPMTYLVWKTRDLRLAILTHCLLNIVGSILSFAALSKP
jgi:uncharacterized protein